MFLDKPVQCALIDDTAGRAIAPPVGVAAWGPMKRHHVVARSKIRNFVDNMHAQGKTDMMNNWISAAVKSHFSQGFIGKKADTTKITRLALPLGVTKETVIANGINPANANNFQEIQACCLACNAFADKIEYQKSDAGNRIYCSGCGVSWGKR